MLVDSCLKVQRSGFATHDDAAPAALVVASSHLDKTTAGGLMTAGRLLTAGGLTTAGVITSALASAVVCIAAPGLAAGAAVAPAAAIGLPATLASFEHPHIPQEIPKIAAAIKTFISHPEGDRSAAFRHLLRRFLWLIYVRTRNDGQGGHLPNPNRHRRGIRLQIKASLPRQSRKRIERHVGQGRVVASQKRTCSQARL